MYISNKTCQTIYVFLAFYVDWIKIQYHFYLRKIARLILTFSLFSGTNCKITTMRKSQKKIIEYQYFKFLEFWEFN